MCYETERVLAAEGVNGQVAPYFLHHYVVYWGFRVYLGHERRGEVREGEELHMRSGGRLMRQKSSMIEGQNQNALQL